MTSSSSRPRSPAIGPSRIFDRPVVVWSGTWRYTNAQIRSVTQALRGRLLVLASAKNVDDYERVAPLVDGDAYYWSSVNPRRYTAFGRKLRPSRPRCTPVAASGSHPPRRASIRAWSVARASWSVTAGTL